MEKFATLSSLIAERARESLPLNSCGSTTVISEIPGIEFPNPTVDCDNVTGVTVSDGSITVMCNGLATGQTNTIQCTSSNGVIIFQVSGAVPGKSQSFQSVVELCLLVVWLCL